MKRLLLSALCAVPAFCIGQTLLYNDGAMIKVQAGATLYVEGGIQNTATGTIDNDGTIEVKGNFINAGTWEPSQPNTLKFTGNVNSDVTSGPAQFQTVIVQKDATFNINLMDTMTINTNLNFNAAGASRVVTNNFKLKLGSSATVTGYDADEYVATTGGVTGMMQKAVTANGTFVFPIGDVTNYSPVSCTFTGSAYATANIRAKANDLTHPNKPTDATDYISRYWDVDETGITGYNNTITGTYIPADLVGTASLVKGAVYGAGAWKYEGAAAGANTAIGSTTVANADFTGTNFFGKINVKVLLDAAYASGPLMTTNLNSGGWIPPVSPYSDAPATVDTSLMPSDITDWVKIEFREVGNPSNIIGKSSAFLKSNGTIVGLDFVSQPLIKNGNPNSIVAVFHRNHLPFRTDVGLDVVNPPVTPIDFSTDTSLVYNNNSSNDPLLFANGKFQMWSCDVSGSTFLLNGTDVTICKTQTAVPFSGYSRADVNLSGTGNGTDVTLTKVATAVPKSADL